MRIVLAIPYAAERSALEQLLRDDGEKVTTSASRADAVELAAQVDPALFLADAQVAGLDGVALVRMLAERGLHPRVLLLCPRAGGQCRVDCMTEPIDLVALRRYLADLAKPESLVA